MKISGKHHINSLENIIFGAMTGITFIIFILSLIVLPKASLFFAGSAANKGQIKPFKRSERHENKRK